MIWMVSHFVWGGSGSWIGPVSACRFHRLSESVTCALHNLDTSHFFPLLSSISNSSSSLSLSLSLCVSPYSAIMNKLFRSTLTTQACIKTCFIYFLFSVYLVLNESAGVSVPRFLHDFFLPQPSFWVAACLQNRRELVC